MSQRRQILRTGVVAVAAQALALTLIAAAPLAVRAQTFPDKPVSIVVPYSPGGTGDILGRVLAQEMGKVLGQNVIVENKAGAGGNLGADLVARSARPDGYTLLLAATSLASNPSLMKKMPFDPRTDLAPIAGPIALQNVVVVNLATPVASIKELIAEAKRNPGKLAFGSSGYGTSNHLAVAQFELQAGVELLHVPYKSGGEAIPALIGGQVQLMFDLIPSAIQQIRGGMLRPLAVTGSKRSPALPDVPTVAEAGVPGYEFSAWFGLFAPRAVPPEIVARLNAAANKAMATAEFQARMTQIGAEAQIMSPEAFGAYFNGEIDKWASVVKSGRLQVLN